MSSMGFILSILPFLFPFEEKEFLQTQMLNTFEEISNLQAENFPEIPCVLEVQRKSFDVLNEGWYLISILEHETEYISSFQFGIFKLKAVVENLENLLEEGKSCIYPPLSSSSFWSSFSEPQSLSLNTILSPSDPWPIVASPVE